MMFLNAGIVFLIHLSMHIPLQAKIKEIVEYNNVGFPGNPQKKSPEVTRTVFVARLMDQVMYRYGGSV